MGSFGLDFLGFALFPFPFNNPHSPIPFVLRKHEFAFLASIPIETRVGVVSLGLQVLGVVRAEVVLLLAQVAVGLVLPRQLDPREVVDQAVLGEVRGVGGPGRLVLPFVGNLALVGFRLESAVFLLNCLLQFSLFVEQVFPSGKPEGVALADARVGGEALVREGRAGARPGPGGLAGPRAVHLRRLSQFFLDLLHPHFLGFDFLFDFVVGVKLLESRLSVVFESLFV